MRKLLALLILTLATFTAQVQCQQPNNQQGQQQTQQKKKDGTEVHLCGAPTKAGGRCKRHVKNAGDLCFMHKAK